MPAGITHLSNI